jgi:hypothetical protein
MRTRSYQLTVIGCALSWFMFGLHLPTLHGMTHPGHSLRWSFVAITLSLAVAGLVALWALLRTPARPTAPPGGAAAL